jgi:hypothetical protein
MKYRFSWGVCPMLWLYILRTLAEVYSHLDRVYSNLIRVYSNLIRVRTHCR